MSKVKNTAYLALTAMLRAREAKMLDRDRMDRMLNASSYADAAKLLVDCGYEDMSGLDAKMLDAVLNARKQEIFEEIYQMSPEPELIDLFRLKYDYHNVKVVLKSAGADGSYLFSDMGRVSGEEIAEAVSTEHWMDLPVIMAEAIEEAKSILAKTGNPQLADFILDRAYFAEMTEIAKVIDDPFVTGYVKIMIDSANMRTAVRTVRMNKGQEFLMQALIPEGEVAPAALVQAAASPEALAALFPASDLREAASYGVEAMKGGSMTKFELACDNAVTAYLERAKLVGFGCEVVIKHLALVEAEITAVRMILSGKMAGIAANVIRERLRDLDA